jgi:hypothetical protein
MISMQNILSPELPLSRCMVRVNQDVFEAIDEHFQFLISNHFWTF